MNFVELRLDELRRIPILRRWVNKASHSSFTTSANEGLGEEVTEHG
jgi:hypothetical protein